MRKPWAQRQLQGFDTADAKKSVNIWKCKQVFGPSANETDGLFQSKQTEEFFERKEISAEPVTLSKESVRPVYDEAPTYEKNSMSKSPIKVLFAIVFFFLGGTAGFIAGIAVALSLDMNASCKWGQ